jgi:uncharacterized protein (DUF924 family)
VTTGRRTDPDEPVWVEEVLGFWFTESDRSSWFARDADFDEIIRSRFLALHEQLAGSEGREVAGARPLLAAVVVLDQFSRNLFRGEARAFAADAIARQLASNAIEQGYDASMSTEQRYFLYLPFEHSEDAADQVRAVELISALGNQVWTKYALAHKAIIDRFGRFPHRNQALGRESSAEEIASMKEPMGAF